jgi:hypothetical protein
MKKYVVVSDLARDLGVDRSNFLKWLKNNGFAARMFDVRTEASRGQATKAVTPEVAKEIIAERRRRGWES